MNFLQYSNNRYQELVVEAAKDPQFSLMRDGEQNALQLLLAVYRFVFKVLFIPKVFVSFFLVNVGFSPIPRPELDMMKAEADMAGASKKAKQARKIGALQ